MTHNDNLIKKFNSSIWLLLFFQLKLIVMNIQRWIRFVSFKGYLFCQNQLNIWFKVQILK